MSYLTTITGSSFLRHTHMHHAHLLLYKFAYRVIARSEILILERASSMRKKRIGDMLYYSHHYIPWYILHLSTKFQAMICIASGWNIPKINSKHWLLQTCIGLSWFRKWTVCNFYLFFVGFNDQWKVSLRAGLKITGVWTQPCLDQYRHHICQHNVYRRPDYSIM